MKKKTNPGIHFLFYLLFVVVFIVFNEIMFKEYFGNDQIPVSILLIISGIWGNIAGMVFLKIPSGPKTYRIINYTVIIIGLGFIFDSLNEKYYHYNIEIYQKFALYFFIGIVAIVSVYELIMYFVEYDKRKALRLIEKGLNMQSKESLNEAQDKYSEALMYISKDEHPEIYASIKKLQGICYLKISDNSNRLENVSKSINLLEDSLHTFKKDSFPEDYASSMYNLAKAHIELFEVTRNRENIVKAVELYIEATTVYTKEDYPEEYEDISSQINSANWKLKLSKL